MQTENRHPARFQGLTIVCFMLLSISACSANNQAVDNGNPSPTFLPAASPSVEANTQTPSTTPTLSLATPTLAEVIQPNTATASVIIPSEIEVFGTQTVDVEPEIWQIPEGYVFAESVIKIYNPGPLSRLVSPFQVIVEVPNNPDDRIVVELFGENGRLLDNRTISDLGPKSYKFSTQVFELKFKLQTVAELGYLRIKLFDAESRLKAMNTIQLILLREGYAFITSYGNLRDKISFHSPPINRSNQDEDFFVYGYLEGDHQGPILISIVNKHGELLSRAEGVLLETNDPQYKIFLANLKVPTENLEGARLQVEADYWLTPGSDTLSSRLLFYSP